MNEPSPPPAFSVSFAFGQQRVSWCCIRWHATETVVYGAPVVAVVLFVGYGPLTWAVLVLVLGRLLRALAARRWPLLLLRWVDRERRALRAGGRTGTLHDHPAGSPRPTRSPDWVDWVWLWVHGQTRYRCGPLTPRAQQLARLLPARLVWFHRWFAARRRWYFLPCPLCGRFMGPHQAVGSIPDERAPGCSTAICARCTRARRRGGVSSDS